jgi:hypothetical protein
VYEYKRFSLDCHGAKEPTGQSNADGCCHPSTSIENKLWAKETVAIAATVINTQSCTVTHQLLDAHGIEPKFPVATTRGLHHQMPIASFAGQAKKPKLQLGKWLSQPVK